MKELFHQWLDAPQIVLDGRELLILLALIFIGVLIYFRAVKEERGRHSEI